METTNNLLTQALDALNKAKIGYSKYELYLQTDLEFSKTVSLLVIAQSLNCLPEILEEIKTTNDILASALGELREFLHPETPQQTPQSAQEYNLMVEQLSQEQKGIQEIAYYVLGRSEHNDDTGWKVEFQVTGYFRNNIETHGDWDICSEAFDTYADAINCMNKKIHYHKTHP